MQEPAAALQIDPQLADAVPDRHVQRFQGLLADRTVVVVHQGTLPVDPRPLLKPQHRARERLVVDL